MEQEKQIQNSDWGFFPIDPSQPAPLDYMDQISYHQRKDRHDEFRTETFTPERLAELEDDNNVHNITINTRDNNIIDAAAPNGQFPAAPLNCSSINEPIIKFLAPPSKSGARNAPKLGTKTRIHPATMPGFTVGKITLNSVTVREA